MSGQIDLLPAPTCPLCSTNDQVQRDHWGGRRVWLCGRCWTVFSGSPGEWNEMRTRRESRAKHYPPPARQEQLL